MSTSLALMKLYRDFSRIFQCLAFVMFLFLILNISATANSYNLVNTVTLHVVIYNMVDAHFTRRKLSLSQETSSFHSTNKYDDERENVCVLNLFSTVTFMCERVSCYIDVTNKHTCCWRTLFLYCSCHCNGAPKRKGKNPSWNNSERNSTQFFVYRAYIVFHLASSLLSLTLFYTITFYFFNREVVCGTKMLHILNTFIFFSCLRLCIC